MTRNLGERAVILGGSVAGMLAARVLSERFAAVVVVERDRLSNIAEPRRGIPQGKHIHGLLAGGQRAIEQLLPGMTQELRANGVPVGDPLADVRLSLDGHRFQPAPSGLTLVSASRDVLELHLRRRVRSIDNVAIVDHCDAVGLVEVAGRITAVRVLRRADHSVEELLEADFVVDATGRGSRAPLWLADIGFPRPEEEQIRVDLGYTTRRYRLPQATLGGALGLLQAPTPRQPRGAALARLEDGVWMLTLIGLREDRPPAGDEDFDTFAASLGSDELTSLIRAAEPIDSPVSFRFPASTRRRYERIRLPENLVVVGDSLASFNPIYGQGMSVAALEAVLLARSLSGKRMPQSRELTRGLARIVDVPWQMAAQNDRAFLTPRETQSRRGQLMTAYVHLIQTAAQHDPDVGRRFLRVSGLIDSPAALLQPGLIWRVLQRRAAAQATTHGSSLTAQRLDDVNISARWSA